MVCGHEWDPSIPQRWRRAALVSVSFWFCAVVGSAFCAIPFIKATNMNLDPPPGTDSYHANEALERHFPALQRRAQFAILVETLRGNFSRPNSTSLKEVTDWMTRVNSTVMAYSKHPVHPSVSGCCIPPTSGVPSMMPKDEVEWFLHGEFISADGTATIVMITLADPKAGGSGDSVVDDFVSYLKDNIMHASWKLPAANYSVGLTGIDVMNVEMVEGAMADLERMDLTTIPLAFAVLAYFLRNIRLMIIPGLTVLSSIVCSFAILYPIALHLDFMTTDPSVVMSNALAFCVDYNLFLCMRFLEGVRARQNLYDNIHKMMRYTAVHCIGVSGSLITLAYLALLFIPSEPLQAMGVAGGMTIICVVLVNTTLTPALFALFGNWFKVSAHEDWRRLRHRCAACRAKCRGDDEELDSDAETATVYSEWAPERPGLSTQQAEPLLRPIWHQFASHSTPVAQLGPLSNRRQSVLGVPVGDPVEGLDLRDLFDSFDTEGTGYVAAEGLFDVMAAAGEPIREKDAVAMIDALEPKQPGKLDFEEFRALLYRLRDAKEEVLLRRQRKSPWFRVTRLIQRAPYFVIILVLAAGSPFWIRVKDISTSMDQFQFMPRDADSVGTFHDIQHKFLPGQVEPFYIVVENNTDYPPPKDNLTVSGVFSPEGWALMDDICSRIQEGTSLASVPASQHAPYSYFIAPVWLPLPAPVGPVHLSWENVTAALNLTKNTSFLCKWQPEKCEQIRAQLADAMQMLIDPEHRAALIQISTPFNSMGTEANSWMQDVRSILERVQSNHSAVKLYLAGAGGSAAVVMLDYEKVVDRTLPIMLAIILGVVAVLIAAVFRSILIPLRLVVTVSYTVAVTFGFAYYVFQTESFEWLFPFLKDFRGDALCWFVPPLAVSITMALGLDYDVFLLVRIVELREFGYTDEAAILKGVYKSGAIISGAGVIMAIAFGGLLASKMEALNQFGVILVVSVLLDTFIIRTMFVPAAMFILGRYNWWPRQMPEPTLTEDDFQEEVENLTGADLIEDGASTVSDWGALSGARSPARTRDASPEVREA
eukprot:TRINITY_DN13145_c0_g1_i1.p1 TRINITY_DN13145_c0_g1~~TRINITY_DN13145_c0_g1_i1.p1  ORF type:complete len:1049 (+),score=370.03 TRINITY_DN13145_c0_g1_i1:105-3251(+)